MAWQSFWLDGWGQGGVQHTQPVDDALAATDSVGKAPGRTTADTLAATDAAARAVAAQRADLLSATDLSAKRAARVLADTALLADQVSPVRAGGHTLSVDDLAAAEDLVCKTLVVLRPPRPTWE